jgi:1,4-dihydroxy-2-naphthoate octaprenyltransferase
MRATPASCITVNSRSLAMMSSPAALAIRPGSLNAWAIAMRPRTLWIATVPVLVGTALAWLESGAVDWSIAALALIGSALIQIISNLQNDVGYSMRGADSASRLGMPRATSSGLLTAQQVRSAIALAIGAAVVVGLPLVMHSGWPVLAMGLTSIIAAISYMGGPRPIAYTPLGELMVFVFFGVVAVAGSGYVQIGAVTPAMWVAACGVGLLAAAVLAVNNHRDIAHDARVGRRTFAVTFGAQSSQQLYATLVLGAFALAPVAAWLAGAATLLAPLLALPIGWRLARKLRGAAGAAMSELLLRTVKLELVYGVLFTAGAIAAGWQ